MTASQLSNHAARFRSPFFLGKKAVLEYADLLGKSQK